MAIPLGPNVAASEPTGVERGLPGDARGMRLPAGVGGWARPEFSSVVNAFAWMFVKYRVGGGGLCVYVDGEPVLDIWSGTARRGQGWTRDTAPIIFSASKGISATIIHRLVDRGLLSYDAPVARYWPEFGANGKSSITLRQILGHRAGLSRLTGIAGSAEEMADHELMQRRLAAAHVDRFYGKPAYHALTVGWLMAGIARAVTGKDMRELYRTEIAEPLGVDGIHLGRPPQGSVTEAAAMYPFLARVARQPFFDSAASLMLGALDRLPGIQGAASTIYEPGAVGIVADDGTANAPLYDMQAPAASAVVTASALGKLYAALAGDGSVDGRRILSPELTAQLAPHPDLRLDRTLVVPMGFHLGYHSIQAPGFGGGFGHAGLGGSMGWADQRRRIAVGLAHNRLPATLALDQLVFMLLWPRIVKAAG